LLGNSFILKPAPTTLITSLMLAKFAKDIFPGGVFNVLTDVNDLGALLTAHPDIAKISFTDSRSEEHTSELQSLMRTPFAVFCLNKKLSQQRKTNHLIPV